MRKSVLFVLCLSVLAFVVTLPAFAGAIHVPEPASILLLGIGIGAVAVVRRISKKS